MNRTAALTKTHKNLRIKHCKKLTNGLLLQEVGLILWLQVLQTIQTDSKTLYLIVLSADSISTILPVFDILRNVNILDFFVFCHYS